MGVKLTADDARALSAENAHYTLDHVLAEVKLSASCGARCAVFGAARLGEDTRLALEELGYTVITDGLRGRVGVRW
jgi:hypothetical protein